MKPRGRVSGFRAAGYAVAVIGFALRGDSCTPPPPPAITFAQQVTSTLADNATATYRFVAPALGNNASIRASFRAEDAAPTNGTYKLEVYSAGTTTLIASAGPETAPDPTLLQDVPVTAGASYDVKLTEVDGTPGRSFKLTMSPRYTLPATQLAAGTTQNLSLATGELETIRFTVGAGETGARDVFFDDLNVAPGNATVTVLAPDKVTVLTTASGSADLSLDASDLPELDLQEAGEYTVIVSDTDPAGQGTFAFSVGPYPGQDDTSAPCEVLPVSPTLSVPVTVSGRALSPVGDRDCFEFSVPFGVSDVTVALDQVTGSSSSNEVRLSSNGGFLANKKKSGDIAATFSVDTGTPDTYRVVVNNLVNGTFNYTLTVGLAGPCIGTGCVLAPDGSVAVSLAAGPVDVAVRADLLTQAPLGLTAAATFELDHTSSGTFQLELLGDRDGNTATLETLCPGASGTADLFLENCDLTTTNGEVTARVSRLSGSGTTATVRMGPELAALAAAPAPILPSGDGSWTTPTADDLGSFGDERIYSFTLGSPAQIGIGFDDQGIGDGNNLVRIYPLATLDAAIRNPAAAWVQAIEPPGTGDGDADGTTLAAGDYALVVDNDKAGQGAFAVCVGPGVDASDEDGQTIALTKDLTTADLAVTRTGALRCGDSDAWTLTTTITQAVKIRADETPAGAAGSVELELLVEDTNNPGVFVPVTSKSGASSATISSVSLTAGRNYRLKVDNSGLGNTSYLITITDPAA